MKTTLKWVISACLAAVATAPVHAGDYPDHPVTVVAPYPPGGAQDTVARMLSNALSKDLGQPVVVDNRASGAGGTIGAGIVAKSAPDGYTLLATIAGIHVVNPVIGEAKLPYEPIASWSPISLLVASPLILLVRSDSPFHTLRELLTYAKAHPGELSYASAGIGTSLHLSGELLKSKAGVDILHVPYKGSAPALNDFVGGRTSMMFGYPASVMEYVKSGRLRMLAVGSSKRLDLIPEVPTISESGLPGFDSDTWTGIVAPAGTPPAVVAKLNTAVNRALEQNRAQLTSQGYVVLGGSPEAMRKRIGDDITNLTPLVARVMRAPAHR